MKIPRRVQDPVNPHSAGKLTKRLDLGITSSELAHLRARAKGWPSFTAWHRAQLNLAPPPGKGGPGARRKRYSCSHCGERGHTIVSCGAAYDALNGEP